MVMDDLRKCYQFCDVIICVGNNKIYVYCLVLVFFSFYFFVMFINGMMESFEEIIILKDFDGNIVGLLIDFVYIGKFDIIIDIV